MTWEIYRNKLEPVLLNASNNLSHSNTTFLRRLFLNEEEKKNTKKKFQKKKFKNQKKKFQKVKRAVIYIV
jgi:hypothetical protein